MPIEKPDSDFDRYENKQGKMDESHKTGKNVYVKGEKRDEKKGK
jgi:hypothetical protein